VISQNAKWGHAGFYIDCHQMTVPENILLQKSTGLEHGADCLHMVQLMPLLSKTPSSIASLKFRLVLPLSYWLAQVVLKKRPLNGCSIVVSLSMFAWR